MKPFANRIESMHPQTLTEIITESYRETTETMYFPNGDKWTGYVENDIFGNRYYEAINKKSGQPYRVTSAPAQRLL